MGNMEKKEALLRLFGVCTLGLAAVLMATGSQTVLFFGVVPKKATYTYSKVYVWSVYIHAIVGGYNLAQLIMCLSSTKVSHKVNSSHFLKWVYFLIDQMAAYIVFGVNSSSTQFSMFAITGEDEFQWLKLCDKYKRFCFQIAGSILCALLGSFILVIISAFSTFNLFRCYSPYYFLSLKPNRISANT